jgi:colanic acid/amylovoran biosynthesis glycosyltransferase
VVREGLDFTMTLVGDGPLRPVLERRARSLGLEDRVRFAGWLDGEAVRRELLASRALVMASFAEGLPVVLMEALACGRAVVATSIAGIPELVEPGASGWLVPAGSRERLAGAIAAVLRSSPAALDAMGAVGAAKVAASHDAAQEGRKLADLFRVAASRRG